MTQSTTPLSSGAHLLRQREDKQKGKLPGTSDAAGAGGKDKAGRGEAVAWGRGVRWRCPRGRAARDPLCCCQSHCDFDKVRKEASRSASIIAGLPPGWASVSRWPRGCGASSLPLSHVFQSGFPPPSCLSPLHGFSAPNSSSVFTLGKKKKSKHGNLLMQTRWGAGENVFLRINHRVLAVLRIW